MAPQIQAASTLHSSSMVDGDHAAAVVSGDTVQIMRDLIENVRTLASQNDYKLVEGYFDEIESLRKALTKKDVTLEAYQTVNATLTQEKSSLQAKLEEKEKIVAELGKQEEGYADQIRQLEELSNKQKDMLKKAKAKFKELETAQKEKEVEVRELTNTLNQKNNQVEKQKIELGKITDANRSLEQELSVKTSKLAELESFVVPLELEGLETS
jgi:chromosome segregation ATPase